MTKVQGAQFTDFVFKKVHYFKPLFRFFFKGGWRCQGLNPGPHTCKACVLGLGLGLAPSPGARRPVHRSLYLKY